MLDARTAGPDLRRQVNLRAIVQLCAMRGHAVVMILHERNLAALSASRIVVPDQGRVAASATLPETVADDILQRVFGVTNAVNQVPGPDAPFVLPHAAKSALPR